MIFQLQKVLSGSFPFFSLLYTKEVISGDDFFFVKHFRFWNLIKKSGWVSWCKFLSFPPPNLISSFQSLQNIINRTSKQANLDPKFHPPFTTQHCHQFSAQWFSIIFSGTSIWGVISWRILNCRIILSNNEWVEYCTIYSQSSF